MGRGWRCCVVVFWGLSSEEVATGDVGAVDGSLEGDDVAGEEGGGEGEGDDCSSLDTSGDDSVG
jgi:hypothetical protein